MDINDAFLSIGHGNGAKANMTAPVRKRFAGSLRKEAFRA